MIVTIMKLSHYSVLISSVILRTFGKGFFSLDPYLILRVIYILRSPLRDQDKPGNLSITNHRTVHVNVLLPDVSKD